MMISIFILTYVVLIFSLSFTPYVTRKTELFGINIPSSETDNPDAKKLRRLYRDITIFVGFIALAVQLILFFFTKISDQMQINIFLIMIFVYLIASFLIYLFFHNKMKTLKANLGWIDSDDSTNDSQIVVDTTLIDEDILPAKWLLLYPLVAAITIICIIIIWPFIPAQIPMQINFDGEVTRWAIKSFKTVILMVSSQWLIFIIMTVIYYVIKNSKRQIDIAEPEDSRFQGHRFRRIMSASMIIGGAVLGAIMGLMFILMFLNTASTLLSAMPFIIILLVVVFVVVLYARIGQGGSRIVTKSQESEALLNRDDDKFWKLGVFYFNKNDPSLFVEKRFGVGYTNNFAKPLSWLLFLGLIAIIVVFAIVTIKLAS